MRRFLILVLGATSLVAGVTAAGVRADSLWPQNGGGLVADVKAHGVGDVLTVIVTEQTTAVSQASTKATKSEGSTFGPGTGPFLKSIGTLGISGNSSLDASGQTSRNGSLNGRLTVTVKSVDASGNLIIEGVRDVTINAENQKMLFSGRVRPADIAPDNTVISPLVADAAITYEGKGPVGNKQHEGIISRVFKILF
jgi:flagellar L-ring protein precursor FlgH